jgi:hypothetical protein
VDYEAEDEVFSLLSQEGLMNPYCPMEIRVVFDPPVEKTFSEDVESLFNPVWSIEVIESSQRISLMLSGKAVHYLVELSEMNLNFERAGDNSGTIKPLKITNNSHFLPTRFSLRAIAHGRFEPPKGVLPPMQC